MDPSPDRTEEKILKRRDVDHRIKLLKFSRRFGQPFATLAGLQYSAGEAVVVIDVGILYAILKIFGFPFPLGNPTIVILVLFLGGIQLISIGILGEYIGRIYEEVR
jgi:glycosyltransferase involved in cell wall biosynthesis